MGYDKNENTSEFITDMDNLIDTLESINVKHFKRVISKQLHYFDHPLFGMVVYISRYQWPEEPQQVDEIN
mgnify:CR=1 FL=1